MALVQLQEAFTQAIFGKQGIDDHEIRDHVANGVGPSAEQRIGVYRAAILSSLTRVLSEVYPVMNQLLGEEFFDAMARIYARQTPSTHPDLGGYGQEMAEFLEGFEPVSELPYLPDVARLEWYWHEIFYEADDEPGEFSALAGLSEEQQGRVVFRLTHSARLLSSEYPISLIWASNQAETEADEEISLDDGPEHLLIWRQGYDRRIDPVTEQEWLLLNALQAGLDFQGLITETGLGNEIGQLIPEMVQKGWITGLELNFDDGAKQ